MNKIILPDSYRLFGERITLRPITIEDTDMVLSWRNSPYVVNSFFYRKPISKGEHINWLETKVFKGLVYQFVVELKETGKPIGVVYLQHFDENGNSMESGVFMSEDMPRGKGYGTEAVKLMNEEFAFRVLSLSGTFARVISTNTASLRLHEKAGFVETSRSLDKLIPDGTEVTSVEFELKNKQ